MHKYKSTTDNTQDKLLGCSYVFCACAVVYISQIDPAFYRVCASNCPSQRLLLSYALELCLSEVITFSDAVVYILHAKELEHTVQIWKRLVRRLGV